MKLNELMKIIKPFTDCLDICDSTIDSLYVAYVYTLKNDKKSDDPMDRFLRYFGDNVEVDNYGKDYACLKAYEFVEEHYDAFKKFTIEENRDEYQMTYEDKDDNIEVALITLNSLICGDFNDREYKKIVDYLEGKLTIKK